MKKYITLIFVLSIIRVALGEVSIRICTAGGEIPFKERKITVGTKLTIVVSSDRGGYWNGGLFINGQNRAYGILSARDFNPKADDWEGSHYEAAGGGAIVSSYQDSWMRGFDLCTGNDAEPGDWFIIDYTAVDIGNSSVGFYEYYLSWDDPNFIIDFSHVPARDFHVDHCESNVENPNASVYVNLIDKPNYIQLDSKRNNAYGARC
ncbi:MAG: hypothetical protein AMJ78_04230 [Omnitrophica WOR_2 bacterium SM23_29]|nr:MAG: hypothetical protein AMJ78_04230 [Omnitrophica WOR_2 bacterium SM23_29]